MRGLRPLAAWAAALGVLGGGSESRAQASVWTASLDDALLGPGSTLPVSLKENVRRAVATDLGCRYCSSFGAPPTEPADIQESLAIAFAELAAEDHRSIGSATRSQRSSPASLAICWQ